MAPESPADEIQRFEEQYRRQPESLVFARLADAYRKAGQPDRALAVLEEGLRRHPDYPSGHIVQARALRDLGRIDETLESFRRVLELDGANLVAIRELAGLAEERGDLEEALHWYRRLAGIDPTDPQVERRVSELEDALAHGERGKEEVASEEPEEEPAGVTDDPPPAGEAAEGPEDWWSDSAVDLAPARPEDEVVEAILNGEVPETVRAEDTWWYEDVPEEDDPEPSSDADLLTRTMADLYAEQGLHREAAEIYEELLRDSPGDPELLARLEKVRGTGLPSDTEPEGGPGSDEAAAGEEPGGDLAPMRGPRGMPWPEELRGMLRAGEEKARSLPEPEPEPVAASSASASNVPDTLDGGEGGESGAGAAPGEDASRALSDFARDWLRTLEAEG